MTSFVNTLRHAYKRRHLGEAIFVKCLKNAMGLKYTNFGNSHRLDFLKLFLQ